MSPFGTAPRTLIALLIALLAVLVVQAATFSPDPVAVLLWAALVAALSVSALLGSRRAAVSLKFLCYFMGAFSLWSLLAWPESVAAVVSTTVLAVLFLTSAIYMSRSRAVARFYAKSPPAKANVA